MMGIVKEFREFAVKGNAIDMAVGIVIGGAFTKIVTSIANDVIMPLVGMLAGGTNFRSLEVILKPETEYSAAVVLRYGQCLQTMLDFVIIAWALFMLVKGMNALRRAQEALF
jgi:large conductance mechanosensitive channel